MRLIKPATEYRGAFLDMVRDFDGNPDDIRPMGTSLDGRDWDAFLENTKRDELGEGLPQGWVSSSRFWLLDDEEQILGVTSVRHRLSPSLILKGGHVGYGIRPSFRRKGYGTAILSLALRECRRMGIFDVMITCDSDNTASEKIILANGGVRDTNTVVDGKEVLRFWIFLEKEQS